MQSPQAFAVSFDWQSAPLEFFQFFGFKLNPLNSFVLRLMPPSKFEASKTPIGFRQLEMS